MRKSFLTVLIIAMCALAPAAHTQTTLTSNGSTVAIGSFSFAQTSVTMYSGFSQDALKITETGGGNIPFYLTKYGQVLLGDLHASYPGLFCNESFSSSVCNDIGPALRIVGDIAIGDVEYFGATSNAGAQWQQIGVRLQGAYGSPTILSSGWQAYAHDTANTVDPGHCGPAATDCGTGSVITYPDDTNQASAQGAVEIDSHGSGAAGDFVGLGTRGSSTTNTSRWQVQGHSPSHGDLLPVAANTYSIGSTTFPVANVQTTELNGVPVSSLVSGTMCVASSTNATALLHFDGPGGATTFADVYGHAFTGHGGAQISIAAPKFGAGNLITAATTDYVSAASSSDWDPRSTNYTVDFWAKFSSFPNAVNAIVGTSQAANDGYWFIYIYNTGAIAVGANGVNEIASAAGVAKADGQWHFYAIVRNNATGTTTIYYDGNSVASATTNWTTAQNQLNVANLAGGSLWSPNVDELRILKGTAYWTGTFTPPIAPWCN